MNHARSRVVVTGLGAVSPLGVGVGAFVQGLRDGRSGVSLLPAELPGREKIKSTVAACCDTFDPRAVLPEAELKRLPRLVPMALAAAAEALRRARLDPAHAPEDIGLILGTGAGGIDFTLDQAQVGYAPGATRQPSLWTITNATHGNLAGELSISLGLKGPSWCLSTGCASSSDAIGLAIESLRSDRPGAPRAMVIVGADAHVRWETLLGMELLRVISTRRAERDEQARAISRPFDRSRDGFVLGEGAWAVVLEREEWAAERGGPILARALGYGATCDAFHRVRPDPEMRESARAMTLALRDAELEPQAIDVLHYHGTATAVNDAAETRAVKMAFGSHAARLAGHSIKGAIGHPQGACGAAAVVGSIGAMLGLDRPDAGGSGGFLPPTINLREPDLEAGCDLDYTPNRARDRGGARRLMVNCLAFGAKNSALVFEVE